MEGILENSSVVRRKRTKRQRLLFSSAAMADVVMFSSTSTEFSLITTEEEKDAANSLVLFARGGHKPRGPEPKATEEATTATKFTNRQFAEAATTTSGKAGLDVHECKSCNKCFPSSHALGGHRASHKKFKLSIPSASSASADETKAAVMSEDSIQLCLNSFSSEVAAKAHECSICDAKFDSGQALGGHMRRHPSHPQEPTRKERNSNGFSLDLNLPPPCDDDGDIAKSSSYVSPTKTLPFFLAAKHRLWWC